MEIVKYIQTIVVLFLVDLIWLSTGGKYAVNMTERIQGSPLQFRYESALIVYLFLAYLFLETKTIKQAFLYGMCIYGVYDFTNYALLNKYDLQFALLDTLWGGILFAIVKYIFITIYH